MEQEITKTDRISDVFAKYPHLRSVFIEKSMRCVGCEIIEFETIAECCQNHQCSTVDEFVSLLNSRRIEPVQPTEE